MRRLYGEEETPCETLGYQLQFIGFLKDLETDDHSSSQTSAYLCCWCASKVEDAYKLKLQCLDAKRLFKDKESIASEQILEPEVPADIDAVLRVATTRLQNMKVKKFPTASVASILSASANYMFNCVRDISFSVKLNACLLANATQYLENILSLLAVVVTLKEESPALKKSVEAIRCEVDLWIMKSAMVNDSASFVRDVANLQSKIVTRLNDGEKESVKVSYKSTVRERKDLQVGVGKSSEATTLVVSDTPAIEEPVTKSGTPGSFVQGVTNLQSKMVTRLGDGGKKTVKVSLKSTVRERKDLQLGVGKSSEATTLVVGSDTPAVEEPVTKSGTSILALNQSEQSKDVCIESESNTHLLTTEELSAMSVRRSDRNRSIVDPLVYYPPFKKSFPVYSSTRKRSCRNLSAPSKNSAKARKRRISQRCTSSKTSADALNDLLVIQNEKLLTVSPHEKEKQHTSAQKRKISNADASQVSQSQCKLKMIPKTLFHSNETPSAPPLHPESYESDKQGDNTKEEAKEVALEQKFKKPNLNREEAALKEEGKECGSKGEEKAVLKKEESKEGTVKEEKLESPGPYTCKICNKVLNSSRSFIAHEHKHTGLSPHKCQFCQKYFSSAWNRVQHERVHTGEKPYVCNICQEAFRYNVTLRSHMNKFHVT